MITLEDIEDISALTRAEIEALAEHERISDFDAALMGDYLMHVHHHCFTLVECSPDRTTGLPIL